MYSQIFDEGVSPLKHKSQIIKGSELQRLNSTIDSKYNELKKAQKDFQIKLDKRNTLGELRQTNMGNGKSADGTARIKA